MAQRGWLGLELPEIRFPRFGTGAESVSLVLSGGGARASFQIGALDYLYHHVEDFRPTTFVGASAGAILAAGLAQHPDPEGQRQFVDQVGQIWSRMKHPDDMFTPRPWFAKLQSQAPTLMDMVRSTAQRAKPLLPFRRGVMASDEEPTAVIDDPLELALTPDEDYQPEWSLGVVAGLVGHLGKLPRLGTELAAIRQGFETTRSMYRPGPMLAELLDPEVFDPRRIEESGMALRVAMVGLESGELRFMREDGTISDRDDHLLSEQRHPLSTGVLASCSIPGVFRPVPLGEETYIDGGARENLPAELGLGGLHVDRSYVITSNTLGVPRRDSMADADIISVVMRATEVLIDEAGRDELAYAHSAGAIVIQPELDVHDAMTIRRGLIRINRDYGWSRAAVTISRAAAQDTSLIEDVYRLRLRCYRWERRLIKAPSDVSTKLRLASAKRDLKEALGRAEASLMPPGASSWWAHWEPHADEVPLEPFWL